MDDLLKTFPLGSRVVTPDGSGIVVGYINRHGQDEVIVSLNILPLAVIDDHIKQDPNPVAVWSYPAYLLNLPAPIPEVHKKFNFDFSLRSHEVNHGQ